MIIREMKVRHIFGTNFAIAVTPATALTPTTADMPAKAGTRASKGTPATMKVARNSTKKIDGKQSRSRTQATAGCQSSQQQQELCNNRVESSSKENRNTGTPATARLLQH
jgi:hypothetical protein